MRFFLFSVAGALSVLALGLLAKLPAALRSERMIAARGAAARGVIVRHEDDGEGGHYPVVRYQASGAVHEFTATGGMASIRNLPVGAVVPVRYLPEQPSLARVDVMSERWGESLALGVGSVIVGSLAALAGIAGWLCR